MKLILTVLLAATALPAAAHGPTPRKTDESVVVNAAPDAVWKQLSEPCAIAKWHPDVASCEALDKKRVLTLKKGGKIVEEFDEISQADHEVDYRLGADSDEKSLPVSSLSGRINVKPDGSGSKVSWMARYYRVFTGNEPPPGQDDESAEQAVNAYVKSGLSGLVQSGSKK